MLPFLKSTPTKMKKQIVQFRGINYSDAFRDGDLRESMNISTRRHPYLTTRRARKKVNEYSGASAMTVRGDLVVVQGTDLLYNGKVVGQVTEGEKQFAVVNTKMVIWPDKVYLDLVAQTVNPMEAEVVCTKATFDSEDGQLRIGSGGRPVGADGNTVNFKDIFNVGDGLTISGSTKDKNNATLKVTRVMANALYFGAGVFEDVEEDEGVAITIARTVPDMDFICEANNRLWGCSSKLQTVYSSVQGDAINFNVNEGLSTDSYALAVGSDGEFTGCCKHGSAVLFWKEARLHKMLGSFPREYAMYDYTIEGLQKGSHKSLQTINEVLYYLGTHGVYAYAGGVPQLLSGNFGERYFTNGVAGNDGDNYYLSAWEGDTSNLLVYETKSGFWFREDATNAVDFARVGKDLYMLDDNGDIWVVDAKEEDKDVEWVAQFTPFHESAEGRKMFSKIILRVEIPKGAWLKAEVRYDGTKWRTAGKIIGRDADSVPLQLPINRCDTFDLRLSGHGPCIIKALLLEYAMGSDV